MRVQHLVCIDSESMEVRRYELETTSYAGEKGERKLSITHEGGFIPTGDRVKELGVIESFRKFPDPRFGVDTEFSPEDGLWMIPEGF